MSRKIFSFSLYLMLLIMSTVLFRFNEQEAFSKSITPDSLELTSQSALLMEPESGTIIYEKNSHEQLRPASVTKIMTLLLIYEAYDAGKFAWDDEVVTSAHAESMGGSQVYLEQGEIQTAGTMTKCIAVASANDAAVAMAEFVGGSEEGFVIMMNERAKELGMKDTNFENASGLDSDQHYTSAYDIALMARELTTKHPEIFDLSTIWMDTITHNTKRGSEEFGLTNTNKLLQWYEGTTGLKTGSTSLAKYCLAGTATRNGLDLIAVVMAAPDYKVRFQEVIKLFDYGFGVCKKYKDPVATQIIQSTPVKKGILEKVDVLAKNDFCFTSVSGDFDSNGVEKTVNLPESLTAPVLKDQVIGNIVYSYKGKELGQVDLLAANDVKKAGFAFYFRKILESYFK